MVNNIYYSILVKKASAHKRIHWSRQIQTIIAALEDTKLTTQDIYLTYIDFRNAFGSIDQVRLLVLMEDLGYPLDAVEIVGNIYETSSTSFTGSHFGTTPPIKISRGTIQGDTLSPYLFIIFLKPLLRWLEKDEAGYCFKTSPSTCTTTAYTDDLAILMDDIQIATICGMVLHEPKPLEMRNHRLP